MFVSSSPRCQVRCQGLEGDIHPGAKGVERRPRVLESAQSERMIGLTFKFSNKVLVSRELREIV